MFSKFRLKFRSLILMDDVLLGGGINGLLDLREEFLRLIQLLLLHKLGEVADHRLHLGLERLTTLTTDNGLSGGFDGGGGDRHKAGGW